MGVTKYILSRQQEAKLVGKKHCNVCDLLLPFEYFNTQNGTVDGFNNYCRDCFRIKMRDYNRRSKGWIPGTPYTKKRGRVPGPPKPKPLKNTRCCDKCDKPLGPMRPGFRVCNNCKADLSHARNIRKYLNRKRNLKTIEKFTKRDLWIRDLGICYLCRQPVALKKSHLEHCIPVTRGGQHTMANCAVAHPACNIAKSDMTPLEYWMRTARPPNKSGVV